MRPPIALLALLVLVAGCDRESGKAPQAAPEAAPRPEPTGTLDISKRGDPAPADAFLTPAGEPVTLADFGGKPLLVNLWATWCGPCVAEMPTLDDLAERTEGRLQVLVVSQDITGAEVVGPYFEQAGFSRLEPYLDPENGLGFAIASGMLPTTVLYDADGKEIWRVVGAMDWDGPRANTLLAGVLGQPAPELTQD